MELNKNIPIAIFSILVYFVGFPIVFIILFGFYPACSYPTHKTTLIGYADIVIMLSLLAYSYILFRYKPNLRVILWLLGSIAIFFSYVLGIFLIGCNGPAAAIQPPTTQNTIATNSYTFTVYVILALALVYIFAFGYWALKSTNKVQNVKIRHPYIIIALLAIIISIMVLAILFSRILFFG